MKTLKDYNIKELTTKVYDFITRANIEIDGKLDGKTIAGQSKFFAKDLQIKNSFKNLYLYQIRDAFYEGVRDEQEDKYIKLNIPTYFRWVRKHKNRIDQAYYNVHTLNEKPDKVSYYEPKKLLK
ncbi:MAG: hypothetical protein Unbinned4026contig1003_47 [Prokaryotic dsDNA virus sp.]|nr:MAG: hypothetical protein Unbinned4026contig1003_47 [Prokaryotic dsDNA virus sp.]|tara:strand:- start:1072 stop:1443 length:372 start_codon:yes stop_codon:yes gene_type:complete